jgi:hypothetical protein
MIWGESMSEKRGQLATYLKTSRKISGKKDQKLRVNLVDLTLFKPDLEELVQLLQNHLQDVEIFIDDQRIIESTQLAQFAEDYQAKTLRARGYWSERAREQSEEQETRLLVELTINKLMAVLSSWKSLEKSEFIVQLKKLLLRRVTTVQHAIQAFLFFIFLSPAYTAITMVLQKPFNSVPHILQSSFECIAGILAVPAFLLLFTRLLLWLKLETRNLLFPGKTTGARTYQRTAMIIRVLIALMLLILFDGFLIIGSAILARFWW